MASSNVCGKHEVNMVKIAAAFALIKQKPDTVTAREYAETCCKGYQLSQHQWRERCHNVESQLLVMKQKEFLAQNNILSESSVISNKSDDSTVFLTPPPSGSVTMETQANNQQQQTQHYLQNHAKFLQSVIHLRTICKHSKVKSTRSKNRGFLTMAQQCQMQRSASDAKIVNETLTRCLQTIYSNVEGDNTSRYLTSLRECSALIVQLLDQDDVKYLIQKEVIKLIELIVHKVCSVDNNAQHEVLLYSDLLQTLLHSSTMEPTLNVLVTETEKFTDHLRGVCCHGNGLDIKWYNNILYICDLFIRVLTHKTSEHLQMESEFLGSVKDRLDVTLLHITDKYPLFSYVVWKVTGCVDRLMYSKQLRSF